MHLSAGAGFVSVFVCDGITDDAASLPKHDPPWISNVDVREDPDHGVVLMPAKASPQKPLYLHVDGPFWNVIFCYLKFSPISVSRLRIPPRNQQPLLCFVLP